MAPKRPAVVPTPRTSWHAPYIGSLHLELWEYRHALSIRAEVPLTSEPLVIDGVVIKKDPAVVIRKNLARIFLTHNIIEFKGPGSGFSSWDFVKCEAYVCLYASFEKVPLRDLTLTIIEAHYPRELFKYLQEEVGLRVKEAFPGIYYVKGGIVPTQIIVTGELSEGENFFLRNLRRGVKAESLVKIFNETHEKLKDPAVRAYMHAVVQVNGESMREVEKMELTEKDRKELKEWWLVKEAVADAKRETEALWQGRVAKQKAAWQERDAKQKAEIKALKARLRASS